MSTLAVQAEHLGKRYSISGPAAPPGTLRESVMRGLRAPWRRLCRDHAVTSAANTVWALKDVSFDVKHGEVLGIIGRNGAGKSTLLKILSRITDPTEGHATVRGRVGSLLEVGTGFHPELTGRENIFLSGAILGMRRSDIKQHFDEIVEFAGIGRYVDTAVKHYSSGMYMRLAFAVAAHLETDTLVIDEVLAVGDAQFQKKCLGKMDALARAGRTVLFVSHNLPAIQRLCQTAVLIDQGRLVACGDVSSVIDAYYKSTMQDHEPAAHRGTPEGTIRFVGWEVASPATAGTYSCYTGDSCTLTFKLSAKRSVDEATFGIALSASDGTLVWAMRNLDNGGQCIPLQEGLYMVRFAVPYLPLKPGPYQILVSANDLREGNLDAWYARPVLQILPKNESGLPPQWQGVLNISGEFGLWAINDDTEEDSQP